LGQRNVIDGTTENAGPQPTKFVVDLGAGQLTVNGIPGLGAQSFQIANFTNVLGTANRDNLVGSAGNDLLDGRGGDDATSWRENPRFHAVIPLRCNYGFGQ
jgi:Ca2+-binding RTX toxin-like protein